jgi:hypothetical protein
LSGNGLECRKGDADSSSRKGDQILANAKWFIRHGLSLKIREFLKSESTNHELTTARKQLEQVVLEVEAKKANEQDFREQSKRQE